MFKPLILSIDFDFFVKEDRALDMGHGDTSMFNTVLWQVREHQWALQGKTVKELVPMVIPPFALVCNVLHRFKIEGTNVAWSESHLGIIEFLDRFHPKGSIEVINFDAHHDLGYHGDDFKKDYSPSCGNWAMQLLRQQRMDQYTLVYPDWRSEVPEPGADKLLPRYQKHLPGINVCSWREWRRQRRRPRKIAGLFICRSGPWVPPCYDGEFNRMVTALTGIQGEAIAQRATAAPPDPNTMEGVLASLVK
jgi:hypothetical protein